MSLKEFFREAKDLLFGNEVVPGCLAWPVIALYGLWLALKSQFFERKVSMSVYPYTPAWPKDEITDAIAGITSGKIATAHEAHCIWSIVGYGLSVVAPDPAPSPAPSPTPKVSLSEVSHLGAAEYLQGHLDGSIPVQSFDWQTLLPILIKLLMTFFGL